MATLIKPNGERLNILPKNDILTLEEMYNLLECSCVQVIPLYDGHLMWIDEEGKLKPHQSEKINIEATMLLIIHGGCRGDYIVGSALITNSTEVK